MPFGISTRAGPRKHVLDEGAHWRNLANTIEPSMCGGDAAFLLNYFDQVLFLNMKRNLEKYKLFMQTLTAMYVFTEVMQGL